MERNLFESESPFRGALASQGHLVIRDKYDEYAQLPIELLCFYHVKT